MKTLKTTLAAVGAVLLCVLTLSPVTAMADMFTSGPYGTAGLVPYSGDDGSTAEKKANSLLYTLTYSGTTRAVTLMGSVSTSGTLTAGYRTVTIYYSSNFTGVIASGTLPGQFASPLTLKAESTSDVLPAIPYTVTTGTLSLILIK